MSKGPNHLFRLDGDMLVPTDLVRGPWDHGLQHGGAVSGALGFAVTEKCQTESDGGDFLLTRLTTEILRPVPVAPIRYLAQTVRLGRRSRVIAAELWQDKTLVARASSQWAIVRTRNDDGSAPAIYDSLAESAVPLRPTMITDPGASDIGYPRPGFNCDVFEMRNLSGSSEEPGPGTTWVRMIVDLVENQQAHPVHPLVALADLGNAIGWERSPEGNAMVNPDVTLQLFRYPVGEWVCLQSQARITGAGIGLMETRLWDGNGQFGLTLSTSMESPIPLTVGLPGGN